MRGPRSYGLVAPRAPLAYAPHATSRRRHTLPRHVAAWQRHAHFAPSLTCKACRARCVPEPKRAPPALHWPLPRLPLLTPSAAMRSARALRALVAARPPLAPHGAAADAGAYGAGLLRALSTAALRRQRPHAAFAPAGAPRAASNDASAGTSHLPPPPVDTHELARFGPCAACALLARRWRAADARAAAAGEAARAERHEPGASGGADVTHLRGRGRHA